MLAALSFVQWDRYTEDDDHLTFYGWIDREQDSYKDFVVVVIEKGGPMGYVTSSAKRDAEISFLLGLDEEPHNTCKRVEHKFPDLKNCIKL